VITSSGTSCNCSKFFAQMPMMKPNRLKRDAGQRQEGHHRDRMQDLEVDEEERRAEDDQPDHRALVAAAPT
jgi:hypothetical protein